MSGRRLAAVAAAFATFVTTVVAFGVAPASAVQTFQPSVVSADPANWTPNVLDGEVDAIAQVGSTVVIGGTFTQLQQNTAGSPVIAQPYIAAFDATTGVISATFHPTLDSSVQAIIPSGDGQSVYVGGYFNTVNGVTTRKVTRLNVTTGATVSGFKAAVPNSNVQDLRLVHGNLIIAGQFTTVGGQPRGQLASLDPTTGKLTTFMQHTFAGPHNGGVLAVTKMDVTPNGNLLMAIGNFSTVDGLDRDLLVVLNTSGATSVVSTWSTTFFAPGCSHSFDTYMRDLDISPDGTYAVVSTTGAYGGQTSPCDTQTRWDLTNENPNQVPVWRNVTGGDTTYAVAISGTAVYVGGHFRWANNPLAGDSAGPGAVPREGIAALDPATGLPLSWNPGRERGVGVFDLLATSQGLWVGDDTTLIGGENRYRIAFFPLAGGTQMPLNSVGTLPNDVYLLGSPTAGTDPSVLYRVNAAGPTIPSVDDGPDWVADQTDPSPYRNTGSSIATYTPSATPDSSIPSTATDRAPISLFDSERWDGSASPEMQWHFPVPTGTHVTVRLYMANRCTCTQNPNQRVFSVQIDGQTVASNIDLAKTYGQNVAHMMSFTRTSDGSVDITFVHQVENPLVNGIEIINNDVTPGPGVGADVVRRQLVDGTSATPTNPATIPSAETWGQSRGSFFVDGTLYSGWADGTLRARSFDGTTFGPSTSVNLYNSNFIADLPSITGIAYLNGRIYYTLANDNNLYWRWFTTESQIVGSLRYTVGNGSAMSPNRVAGMFASGTTLYFADKTDGHLYSAQLTGVGGGTLSEGTVAGPATLVNSAIDWRARGDFVWNGTPALSPNVPPVAAATASCSVNVCTFDGSGSNDPDGTIASYDWTFGDGSQHGAAATMSHAYTAGGTYTATLTVTDDRGATSSATVMVNPASPPNLPPVAAYSPVCTALACTFDASTSFDPDGSVVSYAWDFGDGQTATGPVVSHTFATSGTYPVALSVTDSSSATSSTTMQVAVVDSAPAIGFRVGATASVNATNAKITVPAAVQAGDVMVLFVTSNSANAVTADPAGWTFVGERQDGAPDLRTRLYDKVATGTDAGSTVTVTYSAANKEDLQLAAYTGVDPTTPISAFASAGEGSSRAGHTTPGATVTLNGSWVVSYWTDKSTATTSWTVPGTLSVRGQTAGSGSGHLTSVLADTNAGVTPGASAGVTATASSASAKATMWTVVLAPNGAPPPPNQPPVASFTSSCTGLACTFDGTASSDPDGTVVGYAWSFGDTGTASTATTSHTFAGQGTYTVALTVTDDDGAMTTKSVNLTVAPVASSHVAFRASAAAQANSATQKVTVPASVQSGDALLLFATSNNGTAPTATPAGWTLVGNQPAGAGPDIRTVVYEKTAGSTDAGSQVTLSYAAVNKVDVVVAAYSGVNATTPISAFASAGETVSRTTHTAPSTTVANAGSWVVSYWADKSSATTTWTAPGGQTQRSLSVGTSSGRITSLLTDTNAVVPTGARSGLTATADSASAKATMWTIVLNVAP